MLLGDSVHVTSTSFFNTTINMPPETIRSDAPSLEANFVLYYSFTASSLCLPRLAVASIQVQQAKSQYTYIYMHTHTHIHTLHIHACFILAYFCFHLRNEKNTNAQQRISRNILCNKDLHVHNCTLCIHTLRLCMCMQRYVCVCNRSFTMHTYM